ncbi:MAG: MFS transporter [Candidatus Heimdallarchaeota archaeon]
MLSKDQFKLLMPINLFHTMAHIYPYFLPILMQVIPNEDIYIDYTRVGIIAMTSVLVMIPFTIIIGFIGDRIRKWRLELIIIGYILVFSHTFIIYAANSFAVLIVATVVGGIGASVFHPIALPLLSQEFGAERNLAHSFNLIFGTIGAIITPIATIGLSGWLGWRTATLILGIFGAMCFPILVIMLLLVKKYQKYKPIEDIVMGEKVIFHEKKIKKSNHKKRLALGIITAPLVVVVIAQVIRAGTFRIINTFTSFIFEDQFGATKFNSALIMAIVIGAGGASTFISGFISPRLGSLKTLIISTIASTIVAVFIAIFIGTLEIKNICIWYCFTSNCSNTVRTSHIFILSRRSSK